MFEGGSMAEKVKLSKDGTSIDFTQSDSLPTSVKKFRQSPEIEGFYRFIYENDLQKEAYEILDLIIRLRKQKKSKEKQKPEKTVPTAKPTKVAISKPAGTKAPTLVVKSAPAGSGKSNLTHKGKALIEEKSAKKAASKSTTTKPSVPAKSVASKATAPKAQTGKKASAKPGASSKSKAASKSKPKKR